MLRRIFPPRRCCLFIAGLAFLWAAKWWWDGLQFIGPIPPPGPPKIIYLAYRKGSIWGEIRSMNLDGSGKKLLLSPSIDLVNVNDNVHLEAPEIRPDRRKIVFYIRSKYGESIWTMNMDGSGQRQITPWAYEASGPQYTPDGRDIVFYYLQPAVTDTPAEVCVMTGTGRQRRHLNEPRNDRTVSEAQRLLSPQGPWVVREMTGEGNYRSFQPWRLCAVVHADGSVYPLPKAAKQPFGHFSLSPDRKHFIFLSNKEIYTLNDAGTGLVQLTDDSLYKRKAQFTPDGRQIVFSGGENERHPADLYIMNADGSNQRRLTNTPENEEWFDVR